MTGATSRLRWSGGLLVRAARGLNRLTLPLAGRRWIPVWAILRHRGRRSGRMYATPVAARRIPDGFVIALPFGREVDWLRNLVVAGGGAIRWKAVEYAVRNPEFIGSSEAKGAFHPVQRALLRRVGMDAFVRLRDA